MPPLRPRRNLLSPAVALICGAMLVTASGCATVETVAAQPGTTFELPLGKTAAVTGTGTRITFNQVTEDSRCAIDVVCIWAGDAKIQLTISRSGTPDDVKVISITSPNNETTSSDLRIRFIRLAPAPKSSESPASRAYIAQLLVNRG
jgi:hypothetical protein